VGQVERERRLTMGHGHFRVAGKWVTGWVNGLGPVRIEKGFQKLI
jgi:hypothetical protein